MIGVQDLRKGTTFLDDDGNLFVVLDFAHNKQGRGNATINIKARNLRTGANVQKSYQSGGRVNDVYEVSGQMLKSITYCDAAVLVQHIEHRINAGRHRSPSRFAIGDFQTFRQTLEEAPPTGLTFEVFGVHASRS